MSARHKPFIIFAHPRTGTKMLCSGLMDHPQIPRVIHEFKDKGESVFRETGAALINPHWLDDWMLAEDIVRFHMYREDQIAGAISLAFLQYSFPDNTVDIPKWWVDEKAAERQEWDDKVAALVDWSFSYESMTRGAMIDTLPTDFTDRIFDMIGLPPHTCQIAMKPRTRPMRPKNLDELYDR